MDRRDLFTGALATGVVAAAFATGPANKAGAAKPDFAGPQDIINVRNAGAIADGESHPLSESFATLEDAQAAFPLVADLDLIDETDWAAFQQAVNEAKARGNAIGPTSEKMFPVFLPTGSYVVNRPILIGGDPVANPTEVERGFNLYGTSGRSSEIIWIGSAVDGPVIMNNVAWFHMSDIRILGQTAAEFGIWLRSSGGRAVGNSFLSNISIVGCADGLRVGFSVSGGANSSPSQCLFVGLDITHAENAVHIIGSDTDGQHFHNLVTRDITNAVLRVENGRNIHVDGGVDFGVTDTENRYYLYTTGQPTGGGISVRNIRIESAARLLRLESSPAQTIPAIVEVDNVVAQSVHPSLSGPVELVHWATRGNLSVKNCSLPQPDGYFYFHDMTPIQHIELVLENCQLNSSNYFGTPQEPDALIQAANRVGPIPTTAGALRATLRNNLFLDATGATPVPTDRFRDQVRHYPTKDIDDDVYSLVVDDRMTAFDSAVDVANIELSSGWPAGTTLTDIRGTDRAFTFTLSVGTGPAYNLADMRLTITYKDGPFPKAPHAYTRLVGYPFGTGVAAFLLLNEPQHDRIVITALGTPDNIEVLSYDFTVFLEP